MAVTSPELDLRPSAPIAFALSNLALILTKMGRPTFKGACATWNRDALKLAVRSADLAIMMRPGPNHNPNSNTDSNTNTNSYTNTDNPDPNPNPVLIQI